MDGRKLFFALITAASLAMATAPAAAAEKGKIIVDPDEAASDPDFQTQGEYAADAPGSWGAQVIALDNHKFHAVLYTGGLPGAGWKRGDAKAAADGELSDGTLHLKGGFDATVHAGVMNVAGKGELKRTHRKSPTLGAKPPADATVLFDGKSLDHVKGTMTEDGLLTQGAVSKDQFGGFTMHVEFRLPFKPAGRGQDRGNSGFYIHNRYEVQVLDSFGLEGTFNECGALYRFKAPDVNMCLPPLQWQTYDIDFTPATFDAAGNKTANARISVRHNGVLVQDNVEVPKGTGAGGGRKEVPKEAIYIQDHGNPVRFRNWWIIPK
jgi:3-keto-disaccharide hydrolase